MSRAVTSVGSACVDFFVRGVAVRLYCSSAVRVWLDSKLTVHGLDSRSIGISCRTRIPAAMQAFYEPDRRAQSLECLIEIVRCRNGISELQLAGASRALPLRAMTGALERPHRLSTLTRKCGVHCGGQIESSVAISIRARKLEKGPGGRMQYVRLGCRCVHRWAVECQLETQLSNSRMRDPQRLRTCTLAAQPICALLAGGLRAG